MSDAEASATTAAALAEGPRVPAFDREGAVLAIGERALRRIARSRGPRDGIVRIFLRQGWTEWRLWLDRSVNFRHRENRAAVDAYCAMDDAEFAGINARQAWANWRTIPRNLDGALPNRPVRVVDLCCGTGHSTEVLAWYAAPGSALLGLEYNPRFVAAARRRAYRHAEGAPAEARFTAQSVLETFREPDGSAVADGSIDLVNASGAVGCHFDHAASARLADQVARVLRPGGIALIDSGPAGTPAEDLRAIFAARGFACTGAARSCLVDRYRQLRFVRRS